MGKPYKSFTSTLTGVDVMQTQVIEGNELKLMGIAWLIIAFLFSGMNPTIFLLMLIPVGVVFVGKWLIQKYVAKLLGYNTQFVLYREGIIMSVLVTILSFGHFVLLTIGNLMVLGKTGWGITNQVRDEAMIALAGIGYALALGFLGLFLGASVCGNFWFMLSKVGFFIAFWSALPVFGMEGKKVFEWNKIVWAVAMLASSIGMFSLYY